MENFKKFVWTMKVITFSEYKIVQIPRKKLKQLKHLRLLLTQFLVEFESTILFSQIYFYLG